MRVQSRKICLIGDYAVGKTSLVNRFVSNQFSDRYLTTVGVKVETCLVDVAPGEQIKLVIWDIAGGDKLTSVKQSYLQGASGYCLIADASREETFRSALALQQHVVKNLGDVPCAGLSNKSDLPEGVTLASINETYRFSGGSWVETSALTGQGVRDAFLQLARQLAEII